MWTNTYPPRDPAGSTVNNMAKDNDDNLTKDFVDSDKTVLSPGAALAAKRKQYTKNCEVCGKSFVGNIRKKTCSDKCRKIKSRLNKM